MKDILYMVRDGDTNHELRYSLRSLMNIPHGRVFFAGYKPNWVTNVIAIERRQQPHSKYLNTTRNLIAACHDERLSDDFILMNDDFFIMQPIDELRNYHRGPILPVYRYYRNLSDKGYSRGIAETMAYMQTLGYDPKDILSYELHVPMNINKHKFLEIITQQQATMDIQVLHKRTLYGNLANLGGIRTNDVKIYTDAQPDRSAIFLSSDDTSFERYKVGEYIRKTFRAKSPYEL